MERHDIKSFGNLDGGHDIQLEIIDNEKEFKWQLKMGNEVSRFFSCYESILSHKFSNGSIWYVATAYWEGTFPEFVPFTINPA